MFKVIVAEIKKMLSRPGVYILAAFLALVLILGVYVYNPKPVENKAITLSGDTYMEKYAEFTKENDGIKDTYDERLNKTISYMQYYLVESGDEVISRGEYIQSLYDDFKNAYDEYFATYFQEMVSVSTAQALKETMSQKLIAYNEEVQNAISNSSNGCFSIVTTKDNHKQYLSVYEDVLAWSKITVTEKESINADCKIFKDKYEAKFDSINSKFVYPSFTKAFVEKYTNSTDTSSKFYELSLRLIAINKVIETKKDECQTDNKKNNEEAYLIDDLANLYVNTINTYMNLLKYEMVVKAFKCVSSSKTFDMAEQLDLLYLSNFSSYNSQSLLTRYTFIFDNNKVEESYARPLTIGVTSNNDTNAFDYSYFVLKLFSFVIIFYSVMTISRSIAGEQKEGTLRYLATRPVTRTQLFFGKLLSVLIMAFILTVFSSIISLCVGGAVYGFKSLDILTIFNSKTPIVIHPLGMLGVYMLSMFVEVVIYTSIAYLISVLLNNDLIAVTLTIALIVMNLLLPVFINGINSWLTFYLFSHINLYALFGSTVFAPSGDFFNLLLGAKVYSTTSLALTLTIIAATIAISWILSLIRFKKKEL